MTNLSPSQTATRAGRFSRATRTRWGSPTSGLVATCVGTDLPAAPSAQGGALPSRSGVGATRVPVPQLRPDAVATVPRPGEQAGCPISSAHAQPWPPRTSPARWRATRGPPGARCSQTAWRRAIRLARQRNEPQLPRGTAVPRGVERAPNDRSARAAPQGRSSQSPASSIGLNDGSRTRSASGLCQERA